MHDWCRWHRRHRPLYTHTHTRGATEIADPHIIHSAQAAFLTAAPRGQSSLYLGPHQLELLRDYCQDSPYPSTLPSVSDPAPQDGAAGRLSTEGWVSPGSNLDLPSSRSAVISWSLLVWLLDFQTFLGGSGAVNILHCHFIVLIVVMIVGVWWSSAHWSVRWLWIYWHLRHHCSGSDAWYQHDLLLFSLHKALLKFFISHPESDVLR